MLKIRQKFLLEYNYHSNHLEGNSLTIQETYSMLMNSLSPREAKPMQDIEEMRGHIKTVDALGLLEDVVKDEKAITESLIRDLNRMILVENFKKRRKDENGDDIFVDIVVGQYKTKPNSVETQTGETFRFADPVETAPLVCDLLDWYNSQKHILHPLELAAIFHYKFIRIHPFDDGNGRVARLLMNLILQNNGYPIIIIPSDDHNKEEYYRALMDTDAYIIDLHNAVHSNDVGSFEPFILYIADRLLKSLDWSIRGAKGEDISDISDIIKEAKLWAELHSERNKISSIVSLNDIVDFHKLYDNTFLSVVSYFDEAIKNYLTPYFRNVEFDIPNKNDLLLTSVRMDDVFSFMHYEFIRLYIVDQIALFENIISSGTPISCHITIRSKNSYKLNNGDEIKLMYNFEIFSLGWNFEVLEVKNAYNVVTRQFNTVKVHVCSIKDLRYKTEPNEDYKDAIKQPLKDLSELLKKKLS